LFSGLFRNVAAAPAAGAPRVPADRQRLVFVEEALRGRLREGLRVGEARAVFDAVKAHVAASLNCSVESFEALLRQPPPAGSTSDSELLQAFATVAPSCLRGLGRRYDELADATEAAWAAVPQPLGQPQAKTLLDPEPFTLSYETARLEEITLQPITFTTCELDAQLRRRDSQGQGWALREPLGADGSLGLTMVQIPAGSFAMGSPADEQERRSDEGPQHEVTLASFLMSQTPITQAQWREVAKWQPPQGEKWARDLKPKPSRFKGDDRPVESVSWHDAMEFCKRLSQRTGRHYTLPSEAQWEYACRAATTMPFHFGATITPELVNYDGNYTYAKGPKGAYRAQTTSVASFPANAWGLHDMHGNVWEWCLDHFHESYKDTPVDGRAWLDPVKAEEEDNKKLRLLRGGSWFNGPGFCRSAYRFPLGPFYADTNVGFRVVCLPPFLLTLKPSIP
jgi:formylglycine-generating enzyme required for sulfatase activity